MDAVDDANDVDTTDDLENTQHCILNDENNSSQDSTMSNSQANNVEKAKDNVTPKKQFKSPTLAHVPSRKRRFDDSMVNEAYEAMKQTLAAKKPKDVFTICDEEVAVTLRNLPTTYAQAIVQHKISTLLFEAKLGNYNYPVAQQPQQQAPQAQHQHYYPLSQQYFLPPANSGGLLTILPPQQSPESYSSCSSDALKINDQVMVQLQGWEPAIVVDIDKQRPRAYYVKIRNTGMIINRNRRFLRKFEIDKFNSTEENHAFKQLLEENIYKNSVLMHDPSPVDKDSDTKENVSVNENRPEVVLRKSSRIVKKPKYLIDYV
ncbi:hypothetical protein RN001_003688 [Aquatica leii]|uniref:Uncharacterized protein n=1 Tax=Aquatica leii TaxID=1421715 RepID=A0AAN7SKY3_9COLE|nr:hypothetical protein RN001_003688 [Aquatica leii]